MKLFSISICLIGITACSGPTASVHTITSQTIHTNTNDTIVTGKPFIIAGCYEMIFKRDTARLDLHMNDSIATGHLTYQLYEKDSNSGELKGVLRDSIIDAEYTFQSEGKTSVRTTAFKIHNGTLLQGFGKLQQVDHKIVFKDKTSLQYDTVHTFIKVPCLPKPAAQ